MNDRFDWAVSIMNIKPADRILEIGCGVGFAVERITPLLSKGTITAIDQSKPMTAKATARNQHAIENGTAEIMTSDLLKFTGRKKFNKIFCFNVNLFWTQPDISNEAAVIRQLLAPKGNLFLFFQPPSPSKVPILAGKVTANLVHAKFRVAKTVSEPPFGWCAVAT